MIKRIDSPYKPNERSNNWVKLKGEYIDSIGDTLDLIIIGGYFGERKRIGGG
jgi:ATP-dependent DNA ligase